MKSVSLFIASVFIAAPVIAQTPPPTSNPIKEAAPMIPVAKKVPKTFDNFGEKHLL